MFFKRNGNQKRRTRDPGADVPPRIARLIRESWWLLVVAAFLYLALILATYTKADAGWSYSGSGAPIANRGGVVGAWLSDLLLYLFGFSAWWWVVGGVVLVVLGYRRVVSPEHRSEHPLALGSLGFALTLLLLALFAVGTSLLFGVSWLKVMEHIGAAVENAIASVRRRREAALDRRIGVERAAERESTVEHLREDTALGEPVLVVPQVVTVQKSDRATREKQRPLFTDMPDSPLPPLSLLENAPPATETVSAETLEF